MDAMDTPDAMAYVIHWAGFVGAWLLVAGPLLQGAIELRDEELDREGFEELRGKIEYPAPISRWWWLLPPVAYVKNRRRNDAFHRQAMTVMTPEQRAQFVGFTNKATGWFTVAGGAFLIFLKEAWELAELYEVTLWVYVVVVLLLALGAVANTIVRLSKSDEIIHIDDPDYRRSKRTRTQRPAAGA
ncbi:MAG: hypothetical protein ACTHKX_05895 [Pseudolysinimonas sp.]